MPVGIPTPRHRVPSAHHTVASMREMSDYQDSIHEPPPPPPPWGGWPMHWNQPPPPPPQWNNQPPKWGEHPHVPHPAMLTGGYPQNHMEEEDDYQSEGEIPENHSGYHHGYSAEMCPPPPPPPGYGQTPPMPPPPPPGMPPHMPPMPPPPPGFNPYQFAYSYAHGHAPPLPPPPPAWYPMPAPEEPEDEPREDLQVERKPRTTRRRRSRADEDEWQMMLDDVISKMRSTSPSRRQIAKLQRIVNDARESSGSGSSGLTDEQQQQLEALQEMHYQQQERAARRQVTHQETVREIRQETRNRDRESRAHRVRSTSPGAEPAKPKYVGTQRTSSTRTRSAHRSTSVPSKSMPQQIVTPQTRSTVATRPKKVSSNRPTSTPKAAGGRNAQFVKETHERITRRAHASKRDTSFSDDSRDPVLSFLRKEVMPQDVKKEKDQKARARPTSALPRSTSNKRGQRSAASDGRFVPTERDYMEGLEDLHQKLRRTYMEIQKHPQRFLSQLTTYGTMGGDAHVQSAAELLADQEV
eukprot:TRINITY_DN3228_c0_g2_i2.p1 TRINITY_DN3228_c0_g2~~TRINITY_DN3228_c0_g2_i2.p1  ORF type:complete len:524 (+),score=103.53 TRINITY_DN3228_c0_g2_i2:39-1610(+)